ncbi:MAG: hypothetical protein CM15mV25_1670 [uncultured marine virus]|nr:MAG: hypothetical protein CM15mV25_1670 [uncultured marine virus]
MWWREIALQQITRFSTKAQLKNQIRTLEDTNKWFKKQIEHMIVVGCITIDGIKYRIKVLKRRLRAKKKVKLLKKNTGVNMNKQLKR